LGRVTKYAIDTNLYIRALRDEEAAAGLERFLSEHAPRSYLHSVVLHELLVGAATARGVATIENEIARPLERRRRLVTPSHRSWQDAGAALAQLASAKKLELQSVPRSFVHDALIAASCGEAGVTLVTENGRDFSRLRTVLRFEFVAPWPTGDAGS
jgi:predicted nucleic acid-binding protein